MSPRSRSDPPLRDAARMVSRMAATVAAVCEDTGVSLRQYRTLVHLDEQPRRPSELAEWFGVTRPTLAALARSLETRGLIERKADEEDGRAVVLHVTPAGSDLVARC